MIRRSAPLKRSSRIARHVPVRKVSKRAASVSKLDAAWSLAVRERDGHRCIKCGSPGTPFLPLDAHHVLGRRTHRQFRHDVANGLTACRACHAWFHAHKRLSMVWLCCELRDQLARLAFAQRALDAIHATEAVR